MNICVPLANDGYFFARPESVGVTDQECQDAVQKRIDERRQQVIRNNLDEAILQLSRSETKGKC